MSVTLLDGSHVGCDDLINLPDLHNILSKERSWCLPHYERREMNHNVIFNKIRTRKWFVDLEDQRSIAHPITDGECDDRTASCILCKVTGDHHRMARLSREVTAIVQSMLTISEH